VDDFSVLSWLRCNVDNLWLLDELFAADVRPDFVIPDAAGGMKDDDFDDGGDGDAAAANEQANRAIIASLVANFILICGSICGLTS
jgi:hypothetical protein